MTENLFQKNFKVFQSPFFEPLHLTEDEEGEVWFIGSEICQALEINETPDIYNMLDDDEKKYVSMEASYGDETKHLLVSEPGMYRLVLSSKSAQAKAFRRWLLKGILPSISEDGGYVYQGDAEMHQKA